MKIAIIFPRITGPYGGERLLINFSKALQKLGNDVTIYTHKLDKIEKLNPENIVIKESLYPKINNHQISTLLDLFLMPVLISKINRNIDLLIAIGWQSAFGAFLVKKVPLSSYKPKLIYYCLEPPRLAYDLYQETIGEMSQLKRFFFIPVIFLIRYIDKISVNSFDHLTCISDWTYSQMKRIYGKNPDVIYPGIEVDRFNKISRYEARRKLGIDQKSTVYLSVSKIHKRKRIDLAIKLFQKNKEDNSVFFIIGDGPDKSNLNKIIDRVGEGKIQLLGELSDQDVTLFMKAANYFIFTAKNEPFGIAPLEAEVAGCKVIPQGNRYTPTSWQAMAYKSQKLYEEVIYRT